MIQLCLQQGKMRFFSTRLLQKTSDTINEWTKKWKIKLNKAKSAHINFTNKRLNNLPSLVINGTLAPYENKAKYLGMTFDNKLRWKEHVEKKKVELNMKFRQYKRFIGKYSNLSLYSITLNYNQII